MLDKDDNFYQNIVKSNTVLKFLKNKKHTPYVIELDGESPVLIDLLNTLIPLAEKN